MFDLLDEMSELIYVVDMDTYQLLYINAAGKKIFGIDDMEAAACYELIRGRKEPCRECPNQYLKKDSFYNWEVTIPKVGRTFMLKDKPIEWEGKRAKVEIAFDITEREKRQTELKNILDMDAVILDCVTALHMVQDVQQAMDEIMRQIGTYLKADSAYIFELDGETMEMTHEWHAEDSPLIKSKLQTIGTGFLKNFQDTFEKHYCKVIRDISEIWPQGSAEHRALSEEGVRCIVTAPLILEGQIIGYMGVSNPRPDRVENISSLFSPIEYFVESSIQRQKDKNMLERLSYRDMLTGVMNRNAYMLDIERIASGRRAAAGVLYVDANGMKEINDAHGHQSGDRYLKDIAEKITECIPAGRVYRVGGDEFVVICLKIEKREFEDRVEDLRSKLRSGGGEIAAVGCCWSKDSVHIQKLIYEADEMMYSEKKNFYRRHKMTGRYRHGCDDFLGMEDPAKLRRFLKEGRFVAYYQPKVLIDTQESIGAEALVRYTAQDGRILAPGNFLPFLEEAKLIDMVDFYMFEQVCRRLSQWSERGWDVKPVSVNFSRYTISEPGFSHRLEKIWGKYKIPKRLIEIEVTESVEENGGSFYTVLNEVRQKGFQISIDDFGNKYANFSSVIAFDYDELKVDKSLVDDIATNVKSRAIVGAIMELCEKMKVRLVVEGVENEEQLCILREMAGCGAQGYLFSKPLPEEEYVRLFIDKN